MQLTVVVKLNLTDEQEQHTASHYCGAHVNSPMNPLGYNPTLIMMSLLLLSGIVQVYMPWSAAVINDVDMVWKRRYPGRLNG